MAWTAPISFISNSSLTASVLNTFLRDNLNETGPAKATINGYHFVTNGTNAIAERPWVTKSVTTSQTTTSTSFTNLATVGPQISATTGTRVITVVHCQASNTNDNANNRMSVDISGATTRAAADEFGTSTGGVTSGNSMTLCAAHYHENLTAGTNTFTAKYKVSSGTGTFQKRHLILIAL